MLATKQKLIEKEKKNVEKYKKEVKSTEKIKIIEQLDILLSRFLTGTDSYLFDGYTNINLDNDLIAFNLQELLYSENQRLINKIIFVINCNVKVRAN